MAIATVDKIIYSDVPVEDFNRNGIVVNMEAIKQSLLNLFSTSKGERLNLPEYGLDLPDYIFDNITETTMWLIMVKISEAITYWEPRVRLVQNKSKVTPLYDEHGLELDLVFAVKELTEVEIALSGVIKQKGLVG